MSNFRSIASAAGVVLGVSAVLSTTTNFVIGSIENEIGLRESVNKFYGPNLRSLWIDYANEQHNNRSIFNLPFDALIDVSSRPYSASLNFNGVLPEGTELHVFENSYELFHFPNGKTLGGVDIEGIIKSDTMIEFVGEGIHYFPGGGRLIYDCYDFGKGLECGLYITAPIKSERQRSLEKRVSENEA